MTHCIARIKESVTFLSAYFCDCVVRISLYVFSLLSRAQNTVSSLLFIMFCPLCSKHGCSSVYKLSYKDFVLIDFDKIEGIGFSHSLGPDLSFFYKAEI